jgi:VanZ family protein
MKSVRDIMRYWLPAVFWMGVISLMSTAIFSEQQTSRIIGPFLAFFVPHITPEKAAMIHGVIRKGAHLTEYFILSILLFRALRGDSPKRWQLRWAVCAVVMSCSYAATDEFHQSFVATRTASVVDVGIDTAGAAFAQLVMKCKAVFGAKR